MKGVRINYGAVLFGALCGTIPTALTSHPGRLYGLVLAITATTSAAIGSVGASWYFQRRRRAIRAAFRCTSCGAKLESIDQLAAIADPPRPDVVFCVHCGDRRPKASQARL